VQESHTYLTLALDIERRVFEGTALQSHEITDTTAEPLIEALWDYELA
jgi:hypothetical protein